MLNKKIIQHIYITLVYYGGMESYENIREKYKPSSVELLLIAESPPPASNVESSRHFYRTDRIRNNDQLFTNTIQALYPESPTDAKSIATQKAKWLDKLKTDGIYMIEALPSSLPHNVTKKERQELIKNNLEKLIKKIKTLKNPNTKIVLIKSNVFEIAANPLKSEGFKVLNKELVDYPGQYNQAAYREKLAHLFKLN